MNNFLQRELLQLKKEYDVAADKKLLNYFTAGILLLYPLYLSGESYQGSPLKILLFAVVVLSTAIAYEWLVFKKRAVLHRPDNILDYLFLAYFAGDLFILFMHALKGNRELGSELLVLAVIMAYYLITHGLEYQKRYLHYILYSAVIVYAWLLIHYLVNPQFSAPVSLLLNNPQILAAYAVLVFAVSSICLITAGEEEKTWFYILMNGLSSLFVFMIHDIIGMLIAPVFLLLLPLFYKTTAEFIKRVMQLLFLYFFLLGNMALLANYSGLIKAELFYDMMNSIYLELGIAAAGVLFFSFWDKLPENTDIRALYFPNARKYFILVLTGLGGLFLVLLFAGNKLELLEKNAAGAILAQLVKDFQQYYTGNNGTFYDALSAYGLIGLLEAVAMAYLIIREIYFKCYEDNKELFIILGVFAVQSLFYSQQSVTTPVYMIFLAMALHGKKDSIQQSDSGDIKDAVKVIEVE